MFYKNTSCFAKTFYGVTFQPGETKEVSGYINDKFFIVMDAPQPKSVDKQQKLSSDQSNKKVVPKLEEAKVEPTPQEEHVPESDAAPAKDSSKSSTNKERKS